MAKIEFDDGYVLTSDAHNWTISKKKVFQSGKRAGETRLDPIGHHSVLGSALRALLEAKLKESDATSLDGLHKEISSFKKEVESMLGSSWHSVVGAVRK